MTTAGTTLSPNQEAKRAAIVTAAQTVLLRDGLVACTARAIADESPLSKSALHYYFDDVDEIVDLALEGLLAAFFDDLRAQGATIDSPVERFWTLAARYLDPFEQYPPITFLWFDYWTTRARRGDVATVERIYLAMATFFRELLEPLGVDDASRRAHALTSYILGTVLQQTVHPLPFDRLRAEIAAVCGLDEPGSRRPSHHGEHLAGARPE